MSAHTYERIGSSSCVDDNMELGPFRGLDGPKRLWVAALCWIVGGWAGLHRLYLGDQPKCLLMGWLADGWRLSAMVDVANGKKARGGGEETRVVQPLSRATHAAFPKNRVSNTKYGNTKLQVRSESRHEKSRDCVLTFNQLRCRCGCSSFLSA